MKKWVRRIRAAVGMGLTWGAAWFGAGMILLLFSGFDADVPFPLLFALLGFIAGIAFSGILGSIERRRRFDQMSLARFAGWGAAGGLLLSVIFGFATALGGESLWGEMLVLGPVLALAGAASAAGSLGLARMAERRELSDASVDPAEAELTEGERRDLLGGGR